MDFRYAQRSGGANAPSRFQSTSERLLGITPQEVWAVCLNPRALQRVAPHILSRYDTPMQTFPASTTTSTNGGNQCATSNTAAAPAVGEADGLRASENAQCAALNDTQISPLWLTPQQRQQPRRQYQQYDQQNLQHRPQHRRLQPQPQQQEQQQEQQQCVEIPIHRVSQPPSAKMRLNFVLNDDDEGQLHQEEHENEETEEEEERVHQQNFFQQFHVQTQSCRQDFVVSSTSRVPTPVIARHSVSTQKTGTVVPRLSSSPRSREESRQSCKRRRYQ